MFFFFFFLSHWNNAWIGLWFSVIWSLTAEQDRWEFRNANHLLQISMKTEEVNQYLTRFFCRLWQVVVHIKDFELHVYGPVIQIMISFSQGFFILSTPCRNCYAYRQLHRAKPSPEYTKVFICSGNKYGIKATFFLVLLYCSRRRTMLEPFQNKTKPKIFRN